MENLPPLPTALVFDLGDTIFHADSYSRDAGIRALLEHAEILDGISVEQIKEKGRDIDKRLEASCSKENLEYRQIDFHRLLYGSFGITFTVSEEEAERIYWDHSLHFELEPGLPEALASLQKLGVRRAVISNTVYSAYTLRHELEKKGILDYFEFVISSADYGVRKPDPLLFEVAEGRLGLSASECGYVGNLTDVDVEGAKRAGWSSMWYTGGNIGKEPYETQFERLPENCVVVDNWRDFIRLLSSAPTR